MITLAITMILQYTWSFWLTLLLQKKSKLCFFLSQFAKIVRLLFVAVNINGLISKYSFLLFLQSKEVLIHEISHRDSWLNYNINLARVNTRVFTLDKRTWDFATWDFLSGLWLDYIINLARAITSAQESSLLTEDMRSWAMRFSQWFMTTL